MKILLILTLILSCCCLQSCTVYNRLPTPVGQVTNKGKVKMIQKNAGKATAQKTIVKEYLGITKIDEQTYGGIKMDSTIEILFPNQEETYFYLNNRKKSIAGNFLLWTALGTMISVLGILIFSHLYKPF